MLFAPYSLAREVCVLRIHRHRGVAWVMLVSMVLWGFAPYATAGTQGFSPNQFSHPPIRARQYITIPGNSVTPPVVSKPKITNAPIVIQKQPPLPLPPQATSDAPLNYDQLREAAVNAELAAQKSQLLANQATAAYETQLESFTSAIQQAGFTSMFDEPASTADTDTDADQGATKSQKKWYKIKKKVAANKIADNNKHLDKVVDTDMAGGIAKDMDVRPCNQILGIQIVHQVGGTQFKTSDSGVQFPTYNAAKASIIAKTPIQIGKTGEVYSASASGKNYNACMNIEAMSAQLDFPKKFANAIVLDDAGTWEPKVQAFYSASTKYIKDVHAWMADETTLSDLCAKMILKAEAEDPNLTGRAIDTYGFWLGTKMRYFYMADTTLPMLSSETSIFDGLQIEKIFQAFSKGEVDASTTQPYLSSLMGMLTSEAAGPAALRRLDRAFGFAAAYAASLGSEQTLTKRVAEAGTANDIPKPAAASGSPDPGQFDKAITKLSGGNAWSGQFSISKQKNLTVELPDPAMGVLSNELLTVFYVLGVSLEDFTKRDGFSPLWAFITNFPKQLDDYRFSMSDPSKSFVDMNKGFDILGPSGWRKLRPDWQVPLKHAPEDYPVEVYPGVSYGQLVGGKENTDWHPVAQPPKREYILNSYLSSQPLYEVLSQSARIQDFWLTHKVHIRIGIPEDKLVDVCCQYPASSRIPKHLMEVTNAFGVSAATMLSAHSDSTLTVDTLGYLAPDPNPKKMSNNPGILITKDFLNMEAWKQEIKYFYSYLKKGLQANKDQGDPNVVVAKEIKNFSSVAALFNPISVGFGSCSIYQTLFSPYHKQLGYTCGDYAIPLLELLQPGKPTTKTSAIFRDLRRVNRWFEDLIIPSALAQEDGVDPVEIIPDPAYDLDPPQEPVDMPNYEIDVYGGAWKPPSKNFKGSDPINNINPYFATQEPNVPTPNGEMSVAEKIIVEADTKQVELAQKAIKKELGLPNEYKGVNCEGFHECAINVVEASSGFDSSNYSGSPFDYGVKTAQAFTDNNSAYIKGLYLQNEVLNIAAKLINMPEYQVMFANAQADALATVENPIYIRTFSNLAYKAYDVHPNVKFRTAFEQELLKESKATSHLITLRDFAPNGGEQAHNDKIGHIVVDVADSIQGYFGTMHGKNGGDTYYLNNLSPEQITQTYQNYLTGTLVHEYNHNVAMALYQTHMISLDRLVNAGEVLDHGMNPVLANIFGLPIASTGASNPELTDYDKVRSLLFISWRSLMLGWDDAAVFTK